MLSTSQSLDHMPVRRPPGMPPNSAYAVRRVKDRVAYPHICPHCCCSVALVNNRVIYGRPYGDWPWAYLCSNRACGASVGTHPQTDFPLGTLATAVLREARKRAKNVFNPLWETGLMSRSEAYAALAQELGLGVQACHFGWFDAEQCRRASEAAGALWTRLTVARGA